MKNTSSNISGMASALVLAAFVLATGIVMPSYCKERPLSGPGTEALPPNPNWIPTGNLTTPRSFHTATLLPGGNVLVVAGRDNDLRIRDNAELYEPAPGTWSVTGSLNTARILHTATLLQNGKVLVAGGGVAPGLLNTAELYDPVTGTWSPTGSLAAVHAGHTATLLPNGKVLVSGGTDNFSVLHAAELYDPATGTWGPAGSPTWARSGHTATLLQNGSVLVAGGIVGPYDADNEFPAASNAELYDPASGSWRNVGTAIRLSEHTATLLPNGKVLMAGGYSIRPSGPGGLAVTSRGAELYDPAGEAWSYTGYLSVTRVGHTASLLPNGEVLVAGGAFGAGSYAELYDPDTGMWTNTSSLNAGRWNHTATLLPNGNVLVAGGSDGAQNALNSAELYENVAPPPGTIDASFTGAWYDPAQSGHGLFVEILPGNRVFVGWFTFNPAGTQQAWFVGVGTYSGNTATIAPVSLPTGGRWIPNFDPNRIVNNLWGTLTFTFTNRDHGKVDFNSVAGYGAGSMNLTRLTQPAGLSAVATLHDGAAAGTIGDGYTGAWYDPAQSGHGLFVEVLPDSRMFVGWFTFNPAGTEQSWFVGTGSYSGDTATIIPVNLPSGGRWIPNFDPQQIVNNFWGTFSFTFTDCNHGKVDFNSVVGYGAGSMDLTRLTQPAGLTCP